MKITLELSQHERTQLVDYFGAQPNISIIGVTSPTASDRAAGQPDTWRVTYDVGTRPLALELISAAWRITED